MNESLSVHWLEGPGSVGQTWSQEEYNEDDIDTRLWKERETPVTVCRTVDTPY